MFKVKNTNFVPKLNNRHHILEAIRMNYPLSRNDVANMVDLSFPSVSRIINQLLEEEYLEETDSETSGVGRKAKLITLKERCVITAGVEYDGEYMKIALVDEKGKIITYKSYNVLGHSKEPKEVIKSIYEKIKILLFDEKIEINELFGIGIAVPGIVDNTTGVVRFSAQLNWKNVEIKKYMEEISGINCIVDNDIKAAAYAEYNDRFARKSQISVLLYFGSGLGGAVVIDGIIFRGVTNSAGELGHITQDVNGVLCNCGKEGCIQTNVAKSFLLADAKKVSDVTTLEELFSFKTRQEKWAKRIVNRFITYAALAVDTAVGAYNPDRVIICGEIVENTPNLFEEICDKYYKNYQTDYLKDTFIINMSKLNGKGSVTGSGLLAAEKFFQMV